MRTVLKAAVLLSALLLSPARAQDDGFAPPQAVPTQHVTSTSDAPRAWVPPAEPAPQSRYATQNGPTQMPADAPQTRTASQNTQTSSPPTRYSSQIPSAPPAQLQQPAQAQPQVASPPASRYATQNRPPDLAPARLGTDPAYRLGTGDKVRVIVYGEDDLGGEFDVDSSGLVRLPMIGPTQAGGLTVRDFEAAVAARLADGYLRDPRVSAEVTTYRPFYIIGEVNKPGEYAYVNGMNVVTAVALAGGFTYRADDSDVYIRRNGSRAEVEVPANEKTVINPGDIIRISERFF